MGWVADVGVDPPAAGVRHVCRWPRHGNYVSAFEDLISGGYVGDTMGVVGRWRDRPAIYDATVAALRSVEGTIAASAHQSHSYTDGRCLYFTFAAQVDPDQRAPYYRQAWGAATRAVPGAGRAPPHHHGVGLHRTRFPAHAPRPAVHRRVGLHHAATRNRRA